METAEAGAAWQTASEQDDAPITDNPAAGRRME